MKSFVYILNTPSKHSFANFGADSANFGADTANFHHLWHLFLVPDSTQICISGHCRTLELLDFVWLKRSVIWTRYMQLPKNYPKISFEISIVGKNDVLGLSYQTRHNFALLATAGSMFCNFRCYFFFLKLLPCVD